MSILNEVDQLVSLKTGEVDRRVYSDQEIFEAEMKQIFGRAWLFLCHESQIAHPGDFFEAPMGRDNVLVVRQRDNSIKAMFNSCTHRGNSVCRAEEGNTKKFFCTYHGWTFGLDGRLLGVPGHREFYKGELDKSRLGLLPVAKLASYKGFVFGTQDASAPPLEEFLGPTGRLAIEMIAARGDMMVVPGIQKFVVRCNWKIALDNLLDYYHPQITHASAFTPGAMFPPYAGAVSTEAQHVAKKIDFSSVETDGGENVEVAVATGINGAAFDSVTLLGEYGHAIAGPKASSPGSVEGELDETGTWQKGHGWRDAPEAREALGPIGVEIAGHSQVFPSVTLTNAPGELCLRVPRAPNLTEIWWFAFVDRKHSLARRARTVAMCNRIFGAAGIFEQDDAENWAQSSATAVGTAAGRVKHLLSMNLGHGKIIKEHGLARIEGLTNEHAQLWTYHAWAQWMKGLDWSSLSESTTPGEVL